MTGTGATGTETPDELSVSEIHDVLRNDRRRLVLERLRTAQDAETVPKLDELGIVDYDPDGKTVELAANARELRVYLEAPTGTDGVPPAYYAGVGLLGAVALLGSAAGVPGLRTVGPTAVGIVLSAAVVAGGVYDLRLRR